MDDVIFGKLRQIEVFRAFQRFSFFISSISGMARNLPIFLFLGEIWIYAHNFSFFDIFHFYYNLCC